MGMKNPNTSPIWKIQFGLSWIGPSDVIVFFEKVPVFKGLRAATQRYLHQKADFQSRNNGVPHLERRFFMPILPLAAMRKQPRLFLSFSIPS